MNEKKVTVVTVVCLILIILAGSGAIYYFQFDVLVQKEEELRQLQEQVRVATDKMNQIPGLKKKKEQVIRDLAVESKRIPDLERVEYDRLANLLDSFRSRAGVTVDRAGWNQPKAPIPMPSRPGRLAQIPPKVHKVEYDLSVTGTFYQLIRYINLLEQESRFINVESFSILPGAAAPPPRPAAGGGPTRPPPLNRDLKVIIFTYTYRPDPKPFEIDASVEPPSPTTPIPD